MLPCPSSPRRASPVNDSPVAILALDAPEKELCLLPEGLAQIFIEVLRLRPFILQLTQVQPLPGEVGRQGIRARISQHPPGLLLQLRRIVQLSGDGPVQ
jgi:hypothetical protein